MHGKIRLHDDLEDTPLKWTTTVASTGTVLRQAAAAYNGSFGLQLAITAALPPAVESAEGYRTLPLGQGDRAALEFFWRCADFTEMSFMIIRFRFWDGTNFHNASIEYLATSHEWLYYSELLGWQQIPNGRQVLRNNAWNEFILAADYRNDRYIHLISNNTKYDLTPYTLNHGGNLEGTRSEIQMQIHSNSGNLCTTDFDDIVAKEL